MSWTCQHCHGAYVCLIQQHVSSYIVRFGEDFFSGQRQQAANKHGWFDSILDRIICTKMVCRNRGETNIRETKSILAWLAIVHPSSVVQCLDCESEACWTMTTMKSGSACKFISVSLLFAVQPPLHFQFPVVIHSVRKTLRELQTALYDIHRCLAKDRGNGPFFQRMLVVDVLTYFEFKCVSPTKVPNKLIYWYITNSP